MWIHLNLVFQIGKSNKQNHFSLCYETKRNITYSNNKNKVFSLTQALSTCTSYTHMHKGLQTT